MGRRKFKLCHKKNGERKKYQVTSLVISIPLSLVSVKESTYQLPSSPSDPPGSPIVSIPLSLVSISNSAINDNIEQHPLSPPDVPLTISLPLSLYINLPLNSLSALHSKLKMMPELLSGWVDATSCPSELKICRLHQIGPCPSVQFTITIHEDQTWQVHYKLVRLEVDTAIFQNIPSVMASLGNVCDLVSVIDTSKYCIGNPDKKFAPLLCHHESGVFKDRSGTRAVAIQERETMTIRCANCTILVPSSHKSDRCHSCKVFRSSLRSSLSKKNRAEQSSSSRLEPESHTPLCCLTKDELTTRFRNLRTSHTSAVRQLSIMKRKLETAIDRSGVIVDECTHSDLAEIMKEQNNAIAAKYPTDSFPRVFWEQQMKVATTHDSRGRRWHPVMIKWALYLQHQSSSTYEALRSSGCFALPSQRTLRDYSHCINASVGFSDEGDMQLTRAPEVLNAEEWQKIVILILDEMHIRDDLVYDKHTGALLGFSNLGDINVHLDAFEQSLSTDQCNESLATTMLVIMVRGLFTKLQYPYVQFPARNLSGHELFDPFWEAVFRLERCTLKVVGVTFDGAKPNRRFVMLHKPTAQNASSFYKVPNPYAADGREIFFFSDPPHLIKTARNCFASKARMLWNNGHAISWKHVTDLYQSDGGKCHATPGLCLVPKLKYEHIHLTSFSKMRVDLAAQVLSNSVAAALRLTGGVESCETARFVEMMDKCFDCLNVGDFESGKRSRNAFKAPYHSSTDFRLKWLEDTFLSYLDEWEKSVQNRTGFEKSEQARMLLSRETLLGFRMTVKSFVGLVRFLFSQTGVKAFLSRKICQDPIEKFFGCQRQKGGAHDNPNVGEFLSNTQVLRVVNSFCHVGRGNCRGDSKTPQIQKGSENTPLPKRQSSSRRK